MQTDPHEMRTTFRCPSHRSSLADTPLPFGKVT